ncbi:uncharacterized protein [Musca autumnalis]|uniref:uncharacterized protein n=1 Tax=Musca autumnalis TaxID=221902 RepID=UPI003CF74865
MSGFHPRDLIREVKCRPALYNRDLLEHPRREHKHQLWLEVGEKLTPQEDWESYTDVEKDARVDEIQAKWKHLRDHFYREIKLVNSGEAHKKRKYVYFDDMEFMRDFVGYKMPPGNKTKSKYNDTLDGDNSSSYYMDDNDTDDVMEELLKTNDNAEDDNSETPEPRRNPRRSIKPTPKVQSQKVTPSPPKLNKSHKEVIKNFDGLKKNANGQNTGGATSSGGSGGTAAVPSFRIRDGDISFCLSLVPTFRKLNESAKLRAKIETLKILHKFVEQAEKNKNTADTGASANHSHQDDEHGMQEDHLDDLDETINVKHEQSDDPLHGSSGNTKAWWT